MERAKCTGRRWRIPIHPSGTGRLDEASTFAAIIPNPLRGLLSFLACSWCLWTTAQVNAPVNGPATKTGRYTAFIHATVHPEPTVVLRDATVLDFGCGSGILALAALKLGAARAVGVDNDPQALIASFDSTWSKYFLAILYRHAERYRNINWRLTAAHASGRDVHREHENIFRAAIDRQEARAALAPEAHVRLTHDIVKRQAQLG